MPSPGPGAPMAPATPGPFTRVAAGAQHRQDLFVCPRLAGSRSSSTSPLSLHAQSKAPPVRRRGRTHPLCSSLPLALAPPASPHPWAKLTTALRPQHHPGGRLCQPCRCLWLCHGAAVLGCGHLPAPVLPGVTQDLRRANELQGCLGVIPAPSGAGTSNTLFLPQRARGRHRLNSSALGWVGERGSQGPAPRPQPWGPRLCWGPSQAGWMCWGPSPSFPGDCQDT